MLVLPRSVETKADIQELRAANGVGFYYALTDRAPGPTGFKHLVQGSRLTGEVLLTFTILHREPNAAEVAQVLGMVSLAAHAR